MSEIIDQNYANRVFNSSNTPFGIGRAVSRTAKALRRGLENVEGSYNPIAYASSYQVEASKNMMIKSANGLSLKGGEVVGADAFYLQKSYKDADGDIVTRPGRTVAIVNGYYETLENDILVKKKIKSVEIIDGSTFNINLDDPLANGGQPIKSYVPNISAPKTAADGNVAEPGAGEAAMLMESFLKADATSEMIFSNRGNASNYVQRYKDDDGKEVKFTSITAITPDGKVPYAIVAAGLDVVEPSQLNDVGFGNLYDSQGVDPVYSEIADVNRGAKNERGSNSLAKTNTGYKDKFITNTNRPQNPADINFKNGNFNGRYEQMEKRTTQTHDFKIGDVILQIPPTHMTIAQMRACDSTELINSEAKATSNYAHRIVMKVNTIFEGDQIDNDMKRIMVQFKYCPINIIHSFDLYNLVIAENSWLCESLKRENNSYGLKYVPVTMDEYTIYTIEGHPSSLGFSMQFSLCNFEAYYEGDKNTNGMGYFEVEFDKNGSIKLEEYDAKTPQKTVEARTMKQTPHLERAYHPYNLDIQYILADPERKYIVNRSEEMGFEKSTYSYTRIGKLSSICALDSLGDVKVNDFIDEKNVFVDLLCESMSVRYENNFAWFPVVGFSHAVPQYIGPGHTMLNLNAKVSLDDSFDQFGPNKFTSLAQLMKTYNEKLESEYLFTHYDDRFAITTPLTRLAECQVCSIQNVAITTLPNHPGWSDINITFHKSTFVTSGADHDPVARWDTYWGLSRITRFVNNDKLVRTWLMDKMDSDYRKNKDRLKIVAAWAANSHTPVTNVNTTPELADRIHWAVSQLMNGVKGADPDYRYTYLLKSFNLIGVSQNASYQDVRDAILDFKKVIGSIPKFLINGRISMGSGDFYDGEYGIKVGYTIDLIDSGIFSHGWLSEWGVSQDDYLKAQQACIKFLARVANYCGKNGAILNSGKSMDNKAGSLVKLSETAQKFSPDEIAVIRSAKGAMQSIVTTVASRWEADKYTKTTVNASITQSQIVKILRGYKVEIADSEVDPLMAKLGDDLKAKLKSIASAEDDTEVVLEPTVVKKESETTYIYQFTQIDHLNKSKNAKVLFQSLNEADQKIEDDKFSNVKLNANSLPKPFAAHRYYPQVELFIKFLPQLSASVGGWFFHGMKANPNNIGDSIKKIQDSVDSARSYIVDTPSWRAIYPKNSKPREYLDSGADFNPMNIIPGAVHPSAKKFLEDGFVSAVGPDADNRTKFNLLSPVFATVENSADKGVDLSNLPSNKAFSGITDLMLANKLEFGAYGETMERINKNYMNNKFMSYSSTDNEKHSDSKIDSQLNSTSHFQGVIIPGNNLLVRRGDTTPKGLAGGHLDNYDMLISDDKNVELHSRAIYEHASNFLGAQKDAGTVGTKSKIMETVDTVSSPGETSTNTPEAKKLALQGMLDRSFDRLQADPNFQNFKRFGKDLNTKVVSKVIASYMVTCDNTVWDQMELEEEQVYYLVKFAYNLNMFKTKFMKFNTTVTNWGKYDLDVIRVNLNYTAVPTFYNPNPYVKINAKKLKLKAKSSISNIVPPKGISVLFGLLLVTSAEIKLLFMNEQIIAKGGDMSDDPAFFLPDISKEGSETGQFLTNDYDFRHQFNLWSFKDYEYVTEDKPEVVVTSFHTAVKSLILDSSNVQRLETGARYLNESTRATDETKSFYVNQVLQGMLPTIGMMNAFPTFKLYIIDSKTSEIKFNVLDDYYDFRLVQDLMVLKSKKDPFHILKCRVYVDERFITLNSIPNQRDTDRLTPYQDRTNQFATEMNAGEEGSTRFNLGRCPLRAGMRINLRMGYHTDPRMLDSVFIGTITSLGQTMDSHMFELEAMGDGRELSVPVTENEGNMTGQNFRQIISKILRANTNVIHFGKVYGTAIERFSREHLFLTSVCRHAYNKPWFHYLVAGAINVNAAGAATVGFLGAGLGVGLSAGIALGGAGMLASAFARPFLEDDIQYTKIFIDKVKRDFDDWHNGNNWFNWSKYMHGDVFDLNKSARQISRIFDEAYSYGNDPIDDNIFAVDIWAKLTNFGKQFEMPVNNGKSIWDILVDIKRFYPNYCLDVKPYGNRSTLYLGPRDFLMWRTDDPVLAMTPYLEQRSVQSFKGAWYNQAMQGYVTGINKRNSLLRQESNAQDKPPMVPFQRIHYAASHNNIIMNGVKSTPEKGWNAVIVNWGKGNKPIAFVANSEIHPGAVRKKVFSINWCDREELAISYALSCLKEGVEQMYGGALVLRGNPKIEPHDRIYIADKVNKMFGWVEVETVIHKFDNNFGFTTHIVPNMVCGTNTDAYKTSGHILRQLVNSQMSWGMLGSFVVGGAIGAGTLLASPAIATFLSVASMVGLAVGGLSSVATAVSGMQELFKKIENDNGGGSAAEEEEYMTELLASAARENHMMSAATTGFLVGRVIGISRTIIKNPDMAGKYIKATLQSGYHNIAEMYVKQNVVNLGGKPYAANEAAIGDIASRIKRLAEKIGPEESKITEREDIRKQGLNKQMNEITESLKKLNERVAKGETALPESFKNGMDPAKLTEAFEGYKKELSDLTKEATKRVQDTQRNKIAQGVAEGTTPGKWDTKLKDYGKGTFKAGFTTMMWGVAFKTIEVIPQMFETFMIDSITKNNAITISPVWSKNTLLMAGLDGFQKQNAFLHIKGMLLNAKRVLDSVEGMLLYNTPTIADMGLGGLPDDVVKAMNKNAAKGVASKGGTTRSRYNGYNKYKQAIHEALLIYNPNSGCLPELTKDAYIAAMMEQEVGGHGWGNVAGVPAESVIAGTTTHPQAFGPLQAINEYWWKQAQDAAGHLADRYPALKNVKINPTNFGPLLLQYDDLAIFTGIQVYIFYIKEAQKVEGSNCQRVYATAMRMYKEGQAGYNDPKHPDRVARGNAYAASIVGKLNSMEKDLNPKVMKVADIGSTVGDLVIQTGVKGQEIPCNTHVENCLKLAGIDPKEIMANNIGAQTGSAMLRSGLKSVDINGKKVNLVTDLGVAGGKIMQYNTNNPLANIGPGDILFFTPEGGKLKAGDKRSGLKTSDVDNVNISHTAYVTAFPTDGKTAVPGIITTEGSLGRDYVKYKRYQVETRQGKTQVYGYDCDKTGAKTPGTQKGYVVMLQSFAQTSKLMVR